jgi:hypothetical protein
MHHGGKLGAGRQASRDTARGAFVVGLSRSGPRLAAPKIAGGSLDRHRLLGRSITQAENPRAAAEAILAYGTVGWALNSCGGSLPKMRMK